MRLFDTHSGMLSSLIESAVLFGAVVLASLMVMRSAHATSTQCPAATGCGTEVHRSWQQSQAGRYRAALQRPEGTGLSTAELSDQDLSAFSGVGVIVCTVEGRMRSSTAFLVGAFDIGVTVAHTFEKDGSGIEPQAEDCIYNSVDSLGQVRERIPVSSIKSQWDTEVGASGQPSKDLAVIRLQHPSRYAQRTMPLGRFTGAAAPVVMVGYRDIGTASAKRKARGTAFERRTENLPFPSFTHDMDSRGIDAGAPVIDERTGVIIGIHTRLPARRNGVITMNDWLEATLRGELEAQRGAKAN